MCFCSMRRPRDRDRAREAQDSVADLATKPLAALTVDAPLEPTSAVYGTQVHFRLSARHGPAARLQDRRPASQKNSDMPSGTQAIPYRPLGAFRMPATRRSVLMRRE